MLDEQLLKLIDDTGAVLDLASSVIEKDYYITQVINALAHAENDFFRLIFAGGTCLAKAHKIVKRMSEDVDFKIQVKNSAKLFSKTKLLKELKEFRSVIQSQLILLNLTIDEPIVRNEGKYSRIEIQYPSSFPVSSGLRPHILLEFTLSNVRLPIENLKIITLIEETLKKVTLFTPASIQCVSMAETAIEKWVGLTRKVIAIERKYYSDDSTLVRHIYDLNAMIHENRINDNFFNLAKMIINDDAKQFKNQHPEYSTDPATEIAKSLELLRIQPIWASRYQEFIESMVYGDPTDIGYEHALLNLENISKPIIESLR